jgi:hypothetical protein
VTKTLDFDVLGDVGLQLTTDTIHDDKHLAKVLEDEAFMNEIVHVYVHSPSDEQAATHFILNVNGVNQPVFCGNITPMRRKYVEVLARMKETKFSQPAQNLANPEAGNVLIPRTVQIHAFEVRKDPNPLGQAWLGQILAEAA